MDRVCSICEGEGEASRVHAIRPEGKWSLGRPLYIWKGGIEGYLGDVGSGVLQWVCLAQNSDNCQAAVDTVMIILGA
jgi:hypothetical protein